MIHHYTSINNLALILKTGKIRFTRMDLVDDLKESDGLPLPLEKVAFISCWTEDTEESIPLWKMYTPNLAGVKITLPKDPFKKFRTPVGTYKDVKIYQELCFPLPFEEVFNENYLIYNLFNLDKPDEYATWFYKTVEYRDDYREIYESIMSNSPVRSVTNIDRLYDIGRYKSQKWAFQKESRFTLYCDRYIPLNHDLVRGSRNEQLKLNMARFLPGNGFINQHLFDLQHIDVPLDDTCLNQIRVTLGPKCSDSDLIIVEALLAKYTSGYSLNPSPFTGHIR